MRYKYYSTKETWTWTRVDKLARSVLEGRPFNNRPAVDSLDGQGAGQVSREEARPRRWHSKANDSGKPDKPPTMRESETLDPIQADTFQVG